MRKKLKIPQEVRKDITLSFTGIYHRSDFVPGEVVQVATDNAGGRKSAYLMELAIYMGRFPL